MKKRVLVGLFAGIMIAGTICACSEQENSEKSEYVENQSSVREETPDDAGGNWYTESDAMAHMDNSVEYSAVEEGTNNSSRILYPHAESVEFKEKEGSASPDWSEYDAIIEQIRNETNLEEREALMHKAEDILMESAAIVPLYYYNDMYMQKRDVDGIYSTNMGFKYFQFSSLPREVLKINLSAEPLSLDPALNSAIEIFSMDVNLFSGLYTFNDEGIPIADLAAATEISDDGMTYTFTLIDGAKWSDGTDITMTDFVYSWNRAYSSDTGSELFYMFDPIAKNENGTLDIEAVDDKTLRVKLISPCAYFLQLCATPIYFPVPQVQVEAAEGWQNDPGKWAGDAGFVTNGPYTVSEWKHDELMVLKKNTNYHKADKVSVEELDFMLSEDVEAIAAAYESGELDFTDSVLTRDIESIKNNPEFHTIDNLGTYFLSFNVNSPIFAGKTYWQAIAMRKAMSLLIDREYIVKNIGQANQKIANAFIPEGMSDGHGGKFKKNDDQYSYPLKNETGYYPTEKKEESIENAIALLEEAGYEFTEYGTLSDSTPLSLTYLTNEGTGHVEIAKSIQKNLADIGIRLDIKTYEWNVFLDERSKGNFDLTREGWLADFDDPLNMLEMWTTDSGNNDCQFGR